MEKNSRGIIGLCPIEELGVCMSERLQPDLLARITEEDVRPKDKWRNTELNV